MAKSAGRGILPGHSRLAFDAFWRQLQPCEIRSAEADGP
jgi:hypothetical protein